MEGRTRDPDRYPEKRRKEGSRAFRALLATRVARACNAAARAASAGHMNAITRVLSALTLEVLFATAAPACAGPADIGGFSGEDDDVESEVTVEDTTDIAGALSRGGA
jgi:hypothetical protein